METFKKDQTLYRDEVAYRFVRQLNDFEVQLEKVSSGELSIHSIFGLVQEYVAGTLLTRPKRKHECKQQQTEKDAQLPRLEHLTESSKRDTRWRISYLLELERRDAFSKSRKKLEQDIAVSANSMGDPKPPSVSSVYRWHREFRLAQRDIRAVITDSYRQGGKGRSRLPLEVEKIIADKIDKIVLAQKRATAEDVFNAVFLEIQLHNRTRIESEWLPVPSLRTIQRRISDLAGYELDVARFGEREAERRHEFHGRARKVKHVLELVEIDHTPIDLLVVDERRVVLGRPTITVVLDRKSRCVLGYHLSLAGHGVPAVFAALRHALLPKTYLKSGSYKDLELSWDCFGWPTTLLMDNGPEFHADAVVDALMNLSIIAEYAGSRDPNDKPHVERFLRTLNYSLIHQMPGTTLAKVHQRIGFKSEEEACITLAELDQMIHVWICSRYHLRPHKGLQGRAPMTVWKESAAAYPPQLKMNKEDIDIEFSQVTDSALQHYGIDLNTFQYASPRLAQLRRLLPKNSSVLVKWPSHDAGYVFVWDPMEEEYFRVPNKEEEYSGLTVEQAKYAKKAKASGDPSYRQTNAQADAIVREIKEKALADKALKNRRKGARSSNMTSQDARSEGEEQLPDPPEVASKNSSGGELEPVEQQFAGPIEEVEFDFGDEPLEVQA